MANETDLEEAKKQAEQEAIDLRILNLEHKLAECLDFIRFTTVYCNDSFTRKAALMLLTRLDLDNF